MNRANARARRRVLVVSSVELAEGVVQQLVGNEAETVVVVPAVRQSRLQWLANDDDRARATAERAAQRLADRTPGRTVEARAGDPDPLLAIEDALCEFRPDEVLVVTRPEDSAGWLEQRLLEGEAGTLGSVPVRQVVLDPRRSAA